MNPFHTRSRGWLVLAGLAALAAFTWDSGRKTASHARATEPAIAHRTESGRAPAASPPDGPTARTELRAHPTERRGAHDAGRAEAPAQSPTPASTGGRVVAIDPETGQLGAPSPEQVRALRTVAGSAAVSRNDQGLMETRLSDGTVILDLDGRFEDYALVRVGKNGRLLYGCVHDEGELKKVLRDTIPVPALEEE